MVCCVLWITHAGVGVVDFGVLDSCVDLYDACVPINKHARILSGVAIYNMDVFCHIFECDDYDFELK